MTQAKTNPKADENPTTTNPVSQNKVVLVTVHGTGAGDITAIGDLWWQLGSQFLQELGKRLDLNPSRVVISPFQWELGPNSEAERRKAGMALYERLRSYDEAGIEYYVVGHSHGGSVVYDSLLRSVEKGRTLERLKGWYTIGTPFLDYRRNKRLFQRLNGLGLTFYATGIFSILLGICVWINLRWWGWDPMLSSLRYALFFYGTLCLGGLFLIERFRKSWVSDAKKLQTAKLYADRWFGLWHLEDEAISALANIKNVHAEIIQSNFLQPVVSLVQLGIVAVLGIYLAWDVIVNDAIVLLDEVLALIDVPPELASDQIAGLSVDQINDIYNTYYTTAEMFGGIVGNIVVLFILVLIITYVLKFLAWLVGKPTSGILNNIVWSSIKKRVWGDDILKEDVRAINSHPPEFKDTLGPLPEPVAGPLSGHSERHAIMALHKVRVVLGMSRGSQSTPELRNQLEESLKWQELIHTSYFDVPAFIDLLALGLHRAGMAEFTTDFVMTPEREQLAAWYGGVKVE